MIRFCYTHTIWLLPSPDKLVSASRRKKVKLRLPILCNGINEHAVSMFCCLSRLFSCWSGTLTELFKRKRR